MSMQFHAPTTTKLKTQFIATTATSVSVNQMKKTDTPERKSDPAATREGAREVGGRRGNTHAHTHTHAYMYHTHARHTHTHTHTNTHTCPHNMQYIVPHTYTHT